MKYRIMCRVWFPCQDGYDYMSHEADGELYDNYEVAEDIREKYVRECSNSYEFYISKEDEE